MNAHMQPSAEQSQSVLTSREYGHHHASLRLMECSQQLGSRELATQTMTSTNAIFVSCNACIGAGFVQAKQRNVMSSLSHFYLPT